MSLVGKIGRCGIAGFLVGFLFLIIIFVAVIFWLLLTSFGHPTSFTIRGEFSVVVFSVGFLIGCCIEYTCIRDGIKSW